MPSGWFLLLSLSLLLYELLVPFLPLLSHLLSNAYVFRLVVPGVQAHLIAPGLHPHIKLFSSTPVRKFPGVCWNGTQLHSWLTPERQVVIGSSPIRITWLNGSKRSCPVEIWRMFPRTLVLQAERTTNDHDKSKINKQQDIWYNTKYCQYFVMTLNGV